MRKLAVVVVIFASATILRGAGPWSRSMTLPNDGFVSDVASMRSGVFIVQERLGSPCVVRITSANATTEDCYGLPNETNGGRIVAAKDGIFIYGSSHPEQKGLEAAFVFRIDGSGKLKWARRYASPLPMRITSGAATSDGGLVIVGSSGRIAAERYPWDGEKALVLKLDASGNLQWNRVFDTAGVDELKDVRATQDAIVTAGWAGFGSLIVKLGLDGKTWWTTSLADANVAAIEVMQGGDTVLGGHIYIGQRPEQWMARLNTAGHVEWQEHGSAGLAAITHLHGLPSGDVAAFSVVGTHQAMLLAFRPNGELASATNVSLPDGFRVATLTDEGAIVATELTGRVEVFSVDLHGAAAKITFERLTASALDYPLESGQAVVLTKEQESKPASIPVTLSAGSARKPAPAETTAEAPARSAADAEERAFSDDVRRLFQLKSFDELDRRAAELRANRAEFSDGDPKLAYYYYILTDWKRLGGESQHLETLREWWSKKPKSAAAAIALARTYINAAWTIRGGSVSSTITDAAAARMDELWREAARVVEQSQPFAAIDPEYDVTRVMLNGRSCNDVKAIAYDSTVAQRKYPSFFRTAANYLLPRWCGSPDEYRKYAEFAASAMGPDGDTMYAFIGYDALEIETKAPLGGVPESFFGTYKFDWMRMKRGFTSFLGKHPDDQVIRHELAFTAWKAGDRDSARAAMRQLNETWDETASTVWPMPHDYEEARAWALSVRTEAFVEKSTPSSLKQPSSGPSGWIASAGKQWPPIILRNSLQLRDGSLFGDFNSFLVQTPQGVVAITALSKLDVRRQSQVVPYRLDELRTKLASWTMLPPSGSGDKFTVTSIDRGGIAMWTGVAVTLASNGGKLPVEVLKPRTAPVSSRSRVYIVGCVPTSGPCKQTIYSGELHGRITSGGGPFGTVAVRFDDDVDWRDFAGSPVMDEDGFAIGVVSNDMLPPSGKRNEAMAEEIPLLVSVAN